MLGRVFGKGLCTVVQRGDDSGTFLDSQSCVVFSELTRLMITETKLIREDGNKTSCDDVQQRVRNSSEEETLTLVSFSASEKKHMQH